MTLEVGNLNVWLRAPLDPNLVHIVRGVSFALPEGSSLGLVGESGSGKTMTGLALLRILPRGSRVTGKVTVDGESVLDAPAERLGAIRGKKVAMIFQDPSAALNPLMRVGEQIAEAIRLHDGAGKEAARASSVDWLGRAGIREPGAVARLYPHQLSGGMRQRAIIAQSVCCRPSVLIADEPTTALDVSLQRQVLDLIRELRSEFRMALILISHDLALVSTEVSSLAIMYAGQVVEMGETQAVLDRPRHPYTQLLLKALPVLGKGGRLASISGNPPEFKELPTGCSFSSRCPIVAPKCREAPPPAGKDRNSALCWFA